jgi:hypothetical protein
MPDQIVNRVAKSVLKTIDLEDLYPSGIRVAFDIAPWLSEGIVLREKDFREAVNKHDWNQYKDKYIALHCSIEAIVPAWAFMLIASQLAPFAKKIVQGNLELLETVLFSDIIHQLDSTPFIDKTLIIKGCASKPIPPSAYIELIQKVQPIAKKLLFGEACSSVPLFTRKK